MTMTKALPLLLAAAALATPVAHPADRYRRVRARRGRESVDEVLARARANRSKPAIPLANAFGWYPRP